MNLDARASGVAVFLAEGVLEDAFDVVRGFLVGIDGQVVVPAKAEGTEIVETHDVIGVAVGVEDGIDATNAFAQGLGVEVGAGIDQHGVVVVGEPDGWAGAAVVRVSIGRRGGGAYGAVATEGGHTH